MIKRVHRTKAANRATLFMRSIFLVLIVIDIPLVSRVIVEAVCVVPTQICSVPAANKNNNTSLFFIKIPQGFLVVDINFLQMLRAPPLIAKITL